MERNLLLDVIGWIGVAALLAAYALVSSRRVAGDSVVYQVLNLTGSSLLLINSLYYGAFPSVGVNVAWLGIGFFALGRKAVRSRRGLT
jgi:hypothetical protein